MTEEVGIDQNVVRRNERRVMGEEHVARHLRRFFDEFAANRPLGFSFLLLELFLQSVLLESGVFESDDSFDLVLELISWLEKGHVVPFYEGERRTWPNFLVFFATPMIARRWGRRAYR